MADDTVNTSDAPMGDVLLTVCTTCRRADVDPEGPRPGSVLLQALQEHGLPEGVRMRGVECLSACSRGCTMVLSGGSDRWSYIYGDLDPAQHVTDILAGASAYAQTSDGLVPWRERPQVFRKQSIARIPPAILPSEETQ